REHAAEVATSLERPVRVTVVDNAEAQTVHLVVDPSGTISPEPGKTVEPHRKAVATEAPLATEKSGGPDAETLEQWTDLHSTPSVHVTTQSVPTEKAQQVGDAAALQTRREARKSFLNQAKRDKPATAGWRGVVNSIGFRLPPSMAEQAERDDIHAVSQHWAGPRTIAVVNGKGGAGKTPTTILLSAVFARYGGGGVLAWDNNQTRG